MFDLGTVLDLPLIWAGLIATAIFMYVFLDGFDLGVGILFPFAPSDRCRDKMMNSIAPFWDGNETWLVLGGGGLFAAFPLAYSILMPAFYLPIILMLLGLIFRGVAFEFRFKAGMRNKTKWGFVFHFGSLLAALMQGMILGAFVQGVDVEGRSFAGKPFDWLNGFSVMTGFGVVVGYMLLGSTWVVMKSDGNTREWARRTAKYVLGLVAIFVGVVSLSMPLMDEEIAKFWFSKPNIYYLAPIPLLTAACFAMIWRDLHKEKRDYRPFMFSIFIFLFGYAGIIISLYPYMIPFEVTYWDAAAYSASLSILLVGAVILLPTILAYTAYSYYVFRGKTSHESYY